MSRVSFHTSSCARTQALLSDYLEGGLTSAQRQSVDEHLSGCLPCTAELGQMRSFLRVMGGGCVPPREPSLDMWAAIAPHVAQEQAESRLSVTDRLRLRAGRFVSNFAAGAILFTQALAHNTDTRLRKYLLQDPFRLVEEEGLK